MLPIIAVDTNVVTRLLKGNSEAELLCKNYKLYVPYVVIAELLSGVRSGNNPVKYKAVVESFLNSSRVIRSSNIDLEVLDAYTEVWAYLKPKGKPVSPNDMWIAAECISLGYSLLTYDKDFDNLPQVRRVTI
jgi:predicted nucleic acid-binding protein